MGLELNGSKGTLGMGGGGGGGDIRLEFTHWQSEKIDPHSSFIKLTHHGFYGNPSHRQVCP